MGLPLLAGTGLDWTATGAPNAERQQQREGRGFHGHLSHWGVAYVVAAVLILMLGLIGEVNVWALLYYSWGDLGSYANSVYFSLASFTTIGTSDLALSPFHRISGAIESGVGMLMFGWSTALLFKVIQSLRGTRAPASG